MNFEDTCPIPGASWEAHVRSFALTRLILARSRSLDSSSTLGAAGLREAIPNTKSVLQIVRHVLQTSSELFAHIPHIKAMRFLLFVARHASASDVMCQILMAAQQRCHRRRGGVCSSHQPGNACEVSVCLKSYNSIANARANEVIASIFKLFTKSSHLQAPRTRQR